MAKSLLTDTSEFRWKDIDLSGALMSWSEDLAQRFAGHEYLKRDGAEQEDMGASAGRFQFRCVFLGPTWAKQYRALVKSMRDAPTGQLVHPIFGNIQVACLGISSAGVNPQQARDLIEFTLTFSENALDISLAAEQAEGAATKKAAADDRSADFSAAIAVLVEAAPAITALATTATVSPVTAAAALTTATSSYCEAALAASLSLVPDVSLGAQLAAVASSTEAMILSLTAAPGTDASKYDALASAEELYSAVLELDEAVAALRPTLIEFTVPGLTSLAALSARLYGAADAQSRMDEMLTLNRIPNPGALPGGATLLISAPTADA